MPGTTSTALTSFSHDQHHKTDAVKRKGGRGVQKDPENRPWAGYNEAKVGFQKHYWSTYQMYQWL